MDKEYKDKPLSPRRVMSPEEIPTEEEVLKRLEIERRLNELGIETAVFGKEENEDGFEEDADKLEATLLIMQGKELPKELEEKL